MKNIIICCLVVLSSTIFTIHAEQDSIKIMNQDFQTFESYKDIGYNQVLRPQFHFSSLKNWINDPNGMVWYDGEYHLFFQHNPKSINWGNMTWGHAVSKDMVHWEQLPHAILPYDGGTIFSGTAVVDHNNSLGKQKGDTKSLVAVFTYAKKPFYQAVAYSIDKGKTFQLLNNGSAVLPNQQINTNERDPKVFWHQATKKWVMVLWVKKGAKEGTPEEKLGKIRFFTSDNLVDWTFVSDFDREWVFECMDLVELSVDGNDKNKKWLLYDASFDYEVGEFDGKSFSSDKKSYLGDFGTNFYAAQSFNNSPDGRTVMLGWMRGGKNSIFQKAGMPFNQQLSFPTTMELRTTPEGIRLYRWPINEIEKLYTKSYKFKNLSVDKLNAKLADVNAELMDLSIVFEQKKSLKLILRGLEINYDGKNEVFTYGKTRLVAPAIDGKVMLRVLLDRASIELFANNGAAVATYNAVPEVENQRISISADTDNMISSLIVNKLKSSW